MKKTKDSDNNLDPKNIRSLRFCFWLGAFIWFMVCIYVVGAFLYYSTEEDLANLEFGSVFLTLLFIVSSPFLVGYLCGWLRRVYLKTFWLRGWKFLCKVYFGDHFRLQISDIKKYCNELRLLRVDKWCFLVYVPKLKFNLIEKGLKSEKEKARNLLKGL